MMRNPPGKNGPWTNYTYTDPMKNPPSMTAWGEAAVQDGEGFERRQLYAR
jgi:hypothetical protein